jgi:DNA mismatch repair ATPase MutS
LIRYTKYSTPIELEIPEELCRDDRLPEFEISSKRAGFLRFTTKRLQILEQQLDDAQRNVKGALQPFVKSIFTHFRSKKPIWVKIISFISELECLCSLAKVVLLTDGPVCLP